MRSLCEKIKPFLAMQILGKATELARQGHDIIHLEVGQPDFPTPECVKEAAQKAIRDNISGYTPGNGILPLREAVAEYYASEYNVSVSPERIVITQGSSPGLMMLLQAMCEPGDTVITPGPTYACYDSMINFAGASSIRVPAKEENGFQLDPDMTRKMLLPSTKLIMINSPSNPGGTLISRADLQKLAELGPMLLSDEIYHGLVYEGKAVSALEITSNCLIADGFSKRYAMTGWRLGWIVLPGDPGENKNLAGTVASMQQNFFVCAAAATQVAGIAALKHASQDIKRMAAEYNRRRMVMVDGLTRLGFGIKSSPAGAFYILANAGHLSGDSLALALDILDKAHVGVTPGVDFGPEAEGYLRFCYANSVENIEKALSRIKKYLENR
ncbi:MAG: pyridoxal phosphate-dependent aminotransferase [Deltaproteobacteria bacterium]|jgi:aspartate/methionine/tyrosine aminotransferase|nr:pyridoxal phosphate-dependent aminotransferase [Deltaproteobacteria bacterium]